MADFLQKKKKQKHLQFRILIFYLKKGILLAGTILQIHFNENL